MALVVKDNFLPVIKPVISKHSILIILFVLMAVSTIFADSSNEYFPKEINYKIVFLYLQDKEIVDNNQIRHEYEYILSFLKQAMYAYETNIRNFYSENSLIAFCPMLENGKLIIAEFVKKIYSVDKTTNLVYERLDVKPVIEYLQFIECILTYNSLIDFFYEMTGEMLRVEIDSEKEADKIIRLLMDNGW
jgi:hypothetical protein